jgi:hypothetical protein
VCNLVLANLTIVKLTKQGKKEKKEKDREKKRKPKKLTGRIVDKKQQTRQTNT